MKVKQVLAETINTSLKENLDFNELKSLHIAALRAISADRLDTTDMSDNMIQIVYELQEYGLVDDKYTLTDVGEKAVAMAQTLGGSKERRRAASLKDVQVNPDDIYHDQYAGNDNDIEDDESVFQPNRFGNFN